VYAEKAGLVEVAAAVASDALHEAVLPRPVPVDPSLQIPASRSLRPMTSVILVG
jgi:hypothetical protein